MEDSVPTGYPKVSVVISTYNRPEKLDRALESVWGQTFDDFEVVVVDDCSTTHDENHAVLEKWDANFTARGVDLWAFRLGENSGYQCAPKNRGIEQSRGDYIAYLDDDNTWRTDHLEVCVQAIEADLSTDLVYTRASYHIESPELKQKLFEKFGRHPYPDGDGDGVEWNPNLLNRMNYVDTSCMLHSKGAFWRMVRETGFGWDESLRRFGDWNFVWRWATQGLTGKLVNKVTLDYNVHEGSMQVTRPAMEVPVCFNYASYQGLRADRNAEISLVS
jgi:glycosyltransferase involved in cell wall biosynthesis